MMYFPYTNYSGVNDSGRVEQSHGVELQPCGVKQRQQEQSVVEQPYVQQPYTQQQQTVANRFVSLPHLLSSRTSESGRVRDIHHSHSHSHATYLSCMQIRQ